MLDLLNKPLLALPCGIWQPFSLKQISMDKSNVTKKPMYYLEVAGIVAATTAGWAIIFL